MPELNTFVLEYVAAISYCIEEQKGWYIKDGKFFAIERYVIEELLDRNRYEESSVKLALWKRLHWIDSDADKKHITKSVFIKEKSKSQRLIVVDIMLHKELEKFCIKKR